MKICVAATTFPRWAGDGQGAYIWGLVDALARQGAAVRVVALHTPGAATYERIGAVEVWRPRYWWPEAAERLRKDGGGLPITLRQSQLARVQLPAFLAVWGATLARVARGCDVIHANWTVAGAMALATRPWHRKPILLTVHGSDIFAIPRHPVGAWLTRRVLTHVDYITAPSAALLDAAAKLGAFTARCEVVSNGIDLRNFHPSATRAEPVILFVGFLIPRKGVRYLVEALALLPPRLADWRLVLVGDGPEEANLRAQVAALGLAERVEFAGSQPQDAVAAWMRRAQLFVLPSVEEGQGVVLLEALASGTPIVASDVGGIREVVTPEVGVRVPEADPAALAAALTDLLDDPARRHMMAMTARQVAAAQYDWDVIAAHVLALYGRLATRLPAADAGRSPR